MMHDAIRIIQREHFNISAVLTALEHTADSLDEPGAEPDFPLLLTVLVYLKNFADKFHHPKEDEYLFRALRQRQPDMSSMLDALGAEHNRGHHMAEALRDALEALRGGGDTERTAFVAEARRFIAFQRHHMAAEEQHVLPAAEEALTPKDWAAIEAAFGQNDDPVFGERRGEEYDRLFARIEQLLLNL